MNNETRAMLVGGGVVAALGLGLVALWSMTKAPDPPAVAEARKEEQAVRSHVQNNMNEFMTHYKRANADLAKGLPKERILAHLNIMSEFAEDLETGRLTHEAIPAERIKPLRTQLDNAINAVDNAWPSAKQELSELKQFCINCHEQQKKGPTADTLFPPPLQP